MASSTYKCRIRTEGDRAQAVRVLNEAVIGPKGFQVHFKRWTRTDDQNALMWVLLARFSEQAEINGKKYRPEAWKCIFMDALGHKTNMLPTLDGESFFAEGHRSSQLTIDQFNELIEFIYSEAAERGVALGERTAA